MAISPNGFHDLRHHVYAYLYQQPKSTHDAVIQLMNSEAIVFITNLGALIEITCKIQLRKFFAPGAPGLLNLCGLYDLPKTIGDPFLNKINFQITNQSFVVGMDKDGRVPSVSFHLFDHDHDMSDTDTQFFVVDCDSVNPTLRETLCRNAPALEIQEALIDMGDPFEWLARL